MFKKHAFNWVLAIGRMIKKYTRSFVDSSDIIDF